MMHESLHPTPRGRDVVREQLRLVGLSLRREGLAAAAVLGVVTLLIAVAIVRGAAETWFDSSEWVQFGAVAFLLPFAVWRSERRFGPAFLWTLPVDRRRLALIKVFAGWVWLMAGLAVFVAWDRVLAALSGLAGARTVPLFAFSGATAAYLFGSALVLALRQPLRWLLAAFGALVLMGVLKQGFDGGAYAVDAALSSSGFCAAVENAATSWRTLPHPARWAIATLISVGAGLAALWAALARHGERRRR